MVKVSQRLLSHHFVLWVVQRKLTPNRSLALLFILMRGRAHAATREAHGKPSYDRAAAVADGRMMHNGWAGETHSIELLGGNSIGFLDRLTDRLKMSDFGLGMI